LAISVGLLAIFITWLRISFFPFFFIDKNESPFKSLKLSLAITKGNFFKILLLLFVLGFFQILYLVLNYFQLTVIATFVNILSSFIIVPLSAVALTVAYRKMTDEYKGAEEPDILANII
jgi:membrane-anchored glycerophosphoryl diester phosphodiesterase (GDPDase)